jgi:5-formyltetrahydrofolate cyclo-ligase
VSVYWPFRGEPDLRPWITAIWSKGVRIALPVVVAKGQPLVFREWRPDARLERGVWNIPFPAEGAAVVPTVVIAPLVGFDPAGYRLGYGGGFFDRTLAALDPKPLAIGVGHPVGALATIYPQPHDIPMNWIVTGSASPKPRFVVSQSPT